jgi:hypothetical protein
MVETFRLSRQQDIVGRLVGYFLGHTGFLTDFSEGSIIRSLSEALAKELYNDNVAFSEGLAESIVTSIKQSFNFPLLQATRANGYYTFYRKMLASPIELNADQPSQTAGLTFFESPEKDGVLPTNRNYYYGVSGYVASTGSALSRESASTARLKINSVSAKNSSALLRWESQDGYSGYRIYRASVDPSLISTNIDTYINLQLSGSSSLLAARTPSVSPLQNSYVGEYYFSVVSYEENPTLVPATPRSVGATPLSIKIGKTGLQCAEITFPGIASANYYKIFRSEVGAPFDVQAKTIDRFKNQSLSLSTYYYSITADKSSLISSPPTTQFSVTVNSNLQKTIQLKWLQVTDATGYTIYRGTSGFTTSEKTTPITLSAAAIPDFISLGSQDGGNLDVGKTYFYAVTSIVNSGENHEAESGISMVSEQPVIGSFKANTLVVSRPSGLSSYRVYRWKKTTTNDEVIFQTGTGLRIDSLTLETGKTTINTMSTQTTDASGYTNDSNYSSLWFIEQPYIANSLLYYNRTALAKLTYSSTATPNYALTILDRGFGYHALGSGLTLSAGTMILIPSTTRYSLPSTVTINAGGSDYWAGDIAYVGGAVSGTTRGTVRITSVLLETIGSSVAGTLNITPTIETGIVNYLVVSGLYLMAEKWLPGNKVTLTSAAAAGIVSKTSISSDAFVYSSSVSSDGTYVIKIAAETIVAGSAILTMSCGGNTVSDVRVSGPAFTVSVVTTGSYPNNTFPTSTQVLLNLVSVGGVDADVAGGGTIYDLRVNEMTTANFSAHDVLTYSVGKESGALCDSDQFAYVVSQDGSYSGSTSSPILSSAATVTSASLDLTVVNGAISSAVIPSGLGGTSIKEGDIITVNKEASETLLLPTGTFAKLRVDSVTSGSATTVSVVEGGSGYKLSAYSGINASQTPTFLSIPTTPIVARTYKVTFSNADGRESLPSSASASIITTGRLTWTIPAGATASHVYRSLDAEAWTSGVHLFSIPTTRTITGPFSFTVSNSIATILLSAAYTNNFTIGDVLTFVYATANTIVLTGTCTVVAITDTAVTVTVTNVDSNTSNNPPEIRSIQSISFAQRSIRVTSSTSNTGGGAVSYIDDFLTGNTSVETNSYPTALATGFVTTLPPRYRQTTSLATLIKVRSSRGGTQGLTYNVRRASDIVPKTDLRYLRISENIITGTIHQATLSGFITGSELKVTEMTTGKIVPGHRLLGFTTTAPVYVLRQSNPTLTFGSLTTTGTVGPISTVGSAKQYTVTLPSTAGLYFDVTAGQAVFSAESDTSASSPGTAPSGTVISKTATSFVVQCPLTTTTHAIGGIKNIVITYTATSNGGMGTYVLGYASSSYSGVVGTAVLPAALSTNTVLTATATPKPVAGQLLFHSMSTNLMSFLSGEQDLTLDPSPLIKLSNTYEIDRQSGNVEQLSSGSIYVVAPEKYYSVLGGPSTGSQTISDNNSLYWVPMSTSEDYVLSEKPVIIFRDNNTSGSGSGTYWPTKVFPMRHAVSGPSLNPDDTNNVSAEFYATAAQSSLWPFVERVNTIEKTNLTMTPNTNYFTYVDNGRQSLDLTSDYRAISTLPTSSTAQAITGSITIPYGTQIGVPGTTKRYRTTETSVLSSTQNESLVHVESDISGDFGNTGANTVTELVTNVYGIASGNNTGEIQYGYDPESETQWKMRFSSYLKKLARGTRESIQEGAKTAFIADTKGYVSEAVTSALVSESTNNIVDLYIHNGTSQEVSTTLIAACEKVISGYIDGTTGIIYPGYKAAGIPVTIKASQFKLFNFDVQLTLYSGWSVSTISASVEANINKYINSLDIGDGFDIPTAIASYEDIYDSSETNQYKVVLIDSMGTKSVASSTLTTKARPVKITWTVPSVTTGPLVIGAEILKWSSTLNAWQLLATYYESGDPSSDFVWYKPKRTNTNLFLLSLSTSNGAITNVDTFNATTSTSYRVGDRIEVIQEGGSGGVFTVDKVSSGGILMSTPGAEGAIVPRITGANIDNVHNITIKLNDGGTGYTNGAATTRLVPTYDSIQTKQKMYGFEGGAPYYWDPSPDYQSRQDFIAGLSRYVSRNGRVLVPQDYSFYNDGRKFFQISSLIREIMKTPGVAAVNVVASDELGTAHAVYVPNKGVVIRANTISIR